MKVTALEVRQQQFPLRLRGYDPTAVDLFLDRVAGRLEELVKENAQLWEALAKKDQEIRAIRAQEKDWKQALLAVQQTRDDLIKRGQREAQSLVAEAQRKVHQLLSEAERTRQTIAQDVQLLMCQKRQLIDALHDLLSQHLALLHVQEGQAARRQPSDIPGGVVTRLAAPPTAGDVGYMAPFTNDLAHTGVEESACRRQAAHLVEEFQR
ncbi:MAG TPA: DivIVA domain-containing protein [Candidatus Tectomicrobia bacterium]